LTSFYRDTRVIGIVSGGYVNLHNAECRCESCGPLLLLALSEYEAARLQEALEKRDGRDTGDWHGQLRNKLAEALGPWNPPEAA
jgi:hypothetical protein